MSRRADAAPWIVVVPVKVLGSAKSRLARDLSEDERMSLALAVALDTIDAARLASSVERVVVVSDEPAVRGEFATEADVDVVGEPAEPGLTAAIAHGIAVARSSYADRDRWNAPDSAAAVHGAPATTDLTGGGDADRRRQPVAVLLGDVPALTPDDLDRALNAAARHPLAFVTDADGTGTTLATARAGEPFTPHFGFDSANRHRAAGFADLVALSPGAIAPGLRRDIDTAADLRAALALGVGARTRAAASALQL